MSPFEFFFSFYGLLLGFSVAELVGGFARLLHQRRGIRFGYLTPMLAIFVAVDIATFWNQAWLIFRFAPFSFALLVLGLVIASVFYVAAALVFPRDLRAGESLDEHFWAHRRLVLLGVLAANWMAGGLLITLTLLTGEFSRLELGAAFWGGLALFSAGTLIAAFAPGRRIVGATLVILLAYHGYQIGRAVLAIVAAGGWSALGPAAV